MTNIKGIALLVLIATVGFQAQSQAQENQNSSGSQQQSKIKKSDLGVKEKETKDIDDEITNARLRASTGSKSKFSVQTELGYSGGSLNAPLGKTRPKLDAGPIVPNYTAAYGTISGKYRINENQNINLGSGIGLTTPGHDGQRSELQDPYISYTYLTAIKGIQNVLVAQFTAHSSKANLDAKNEYGVDLTHTMVTNLGATKWQLGLATAFSYEGYSELIKENSSAPQYIIGFYPFAEYSFTDSYSFRTVYRGGTFAMLTSESDKMYWSEATQSMGVGMAITRDIYLYPNIQWVWRDIRTDKTNIALSANINFF